MSADLWDYTVRRTEKRLGISKNHIGPYRLVLRSTQWRHQYDMVLAALSDCTDKTDILTTLSTKTPETPETDLGWGTANNPFTISRFNKFSPLIKLFTGQTSRKPVDYCSSLGNLTGNKAVPTVMHSLSTVGKTTLRLANHMSQGADLGPLGLTGEDSRNLLSHRNSALVDPQADKSSTEKDVLVNVTKMRILVSHSTDLYAGVLGQRGMLMLLFLSLTFKLVYSRKHPKGNRVVALFVCTCTLWCLAGYFDDITKTKSEKIITQALHWHVLCAEVPIFV